MLITQVGVYRTVRRKVRARAGAGAGRGRGQTGAEARTRAGAKADDSEYGSMLSCPIPDLCFNLNTSDQF